jgi:hypothetical protein
MSQKMVTRAVTNITTSNLMGNHHHNTLTAISAKYIKNTSEVITNTTLQILINKMTVNLKIS